METSVGVTGLFPYGVCSDGFMFKAIAREYDIYRGGGGGVITVWNSGVTRIQNWGGGGGVRER